MVRGGMRRLERHIVKCSRSLRGASKCCSTASDWLESRSTLSFARMDVIIAEERPVAAKPRAWMFSTFIFLALAMWPLSQAFESEGGLLIGLNVFQVVIYLGLAVMVVVMRNHVPAKSAVSNRQQKWAMAAPILASVGLGAAFWLSVGAT